MSSTLPRLDRSTVSRLPEAAQPLVPAGALQPRIVHLGLGAFHRAHQAVYTEQAAAITGTPWGIVGVEPLSVPAVAALREQDLLYSVTDRAPRAGTTRVVGSLVGALHLTQDAAAVDDLLSSEAVSTVTLTVTEKGYYRRPGTDRLDLAAPPVASDLAASADPAAVCGTVIGRLATSLRARRRRNGAPVDVVSCDNMAGNGPALASVVRDFVVATAWDDRDDLLEWLERSVSFPATIVDRIVPATTTEDRDLASAALGLRDEMPVLGEPFRQWVLQDVFGAPRPAWETAGALFVPDVAPYQLMKLRLLNGSHSAMAYLGLATGCRTVAEVLTTPWGEAIVRAFGAEVAPSLPPAGPDPSAYVGELVERYRNPAMQHLLRQIGSDGSLKIPERWLAALRELRAAGRQTPVLELALAAWVLATRPGDDTAQAFGTTDPLAARLATAWEGSADDSSRVADLLRVIGADDLAETAEVTSGVAARMPSVAAGHVEL